MHAFTESYNQWLKEDRLRRNALLEARQWQEDLKWAIRSRLIRPVHTTGHANLETYIWACQNDCVSGWNFVTQRYEH